MRISDWSSGVCSSDLLTDPGEVGRLTVLKHEIRNVERVSSGSKLDPVGYGPFDERSQAVQIFRASKNCSIFFKPLRLNEGLACIIKRPDHAVDQVPFAFHSFCGHGENLFEAPLPDMRRNGHNSADAIVHRYAVQGVRKSTRLNSSH